MQTTQVVTFNHAPFCCLNMGSTPYAKGFRRHIWCCDIPEIEIKHALGNSRADFARVKHTLYSCRNMNCYIVIQTTENGKLLRWPRMWMRFLERERSPLYLWTVVHTEGKYICIHTHKAIYECALHALSNIYMNLCLNNDFYFPKYKHALECAHTHYIMWGSG